MPGICGMSFGTPKRRRLSSIIPQLGSLNLETTEEKIKALEQEKLEYEGKLLILSGAAVLAKEQLAESEKSSSCAFCQRSVDEQNVENMINNVKAYRTAVTASKYVAKRAECIKQLAALNNSGSPQKSNREKSFEWFTHELKKGKAITLRQQKLQSLRVERCVCCGKPMNRDDLPDFLKSVDRLARNMESELHVHKTIKSKSKKRSRSL